MGKIPWRRIFAALHPMNWLFTKLPPAGQCNLVLGNGRIFAYVPAIRPHDEPDDGNGPGDGGLSIDSDPLPSGPTGGVTDDALRELIAAERVPA